METVSQKTETVVIDSYLTVSGGIIVSLAGDDDDAPLAKVTLHNECEGLNEAQRRRLAKEIQRSVIHQLEQAGIIKRPRRALAPQVVPTHAELMAIPGTEDVGDGKYSLQSRGGIIYTYIPDANGFSVEGLYEGGTHRPSNIAGIWTLMEAK